MSDDEDLADTPYLLITAGYLMLFAQIGAFFLFLWFFWSDQLILSFSDINNGPLSWHGIGSVWFIFTWGLVATVGIFVITGRPSSYSSKLSLFAKGLWISINAGVFEELIYRWMVFFSAMIMLPFFNFITYGLVKWVYMTLLIPLADFATLHALHPFLLGGGTWVLGAAIVSASIEFRNQHEHLGLFGWVNSWFMGMVLFYLMLNYNLLTAIVAHILYDIVVFSVAALTTK